MRVGRQPGDAGSGTGQGEAASSWKKSLMEEEQFEDFLNVISEVVHSSFLSANSPCCAGCLPSAVRRRASMCTGTACYAACADVGTPWLCCTCVPSSQALERSDTEVEQAEHIKKAFDDKHGPVWHCISGNQVW